MQNSLHTLFLDVMPAALIGIIIVYATVDTVSNSTFVFTCGGAEDYFAEMWGGGGGRACFLFFF